MTLLDRVKQLCAANGISQAKLEKEIGISSGASYKWKNSSPSMEVLEKLSKYFGVSVDYLMTGKEKEGGETYYLNDETREIAQEIFENPDVKSLFDMSRKMTPERLKAHIEFIKKMQDSEN